MRATESGFNQWVYLTAAQERITTANRLFHAEPPDYVLACYAAGVAVECLFHAYRERAGADNTARHDLGLHAQLGLFYDGMSSWQRQSVSALVSEVVSRWQNNHRYRSEEALRSKTMHKLIARVTNVLSERFPGAEPALTPVPQGERAGGFLAWSGFDGVPQRERQRMVWDTLRARLTLDDQQRVTAILTLTPFEQDDVLDTAA